MRNLQLAVVISDDVQGRIVGKQLAAHAAAVNYLKLVGFRVILHSNNGVQVLYPVIQRGIDSHSFSTSTGVAHAVFQVDSSIYFAALGTQCSTNANKVFLESLFGVVAGNLNEFKILG